MCTTENIRPAASVFSILYMFAAMGFIAVGVLLLIATYAEMAFGANVPAIGFYFTSVGGIMMCTANCAVYGTRNHNKFCLFIHLIVVLTLFVVLVFAAVSLMGTINFDPVPDLDFQDRCMRAQKNLTDSCKSTYLADPLRKKLQNLWHTLHEESLGEAEIYRNKETGAAQPDIVMKDLLVALEDGQAGFGIACCGFLPPNQCDKDIAWEGKCGVKPGWYPSTRYCSLDVNGRNVLDPNYDGGRQAVGCPFDQPVGVCGVLEYTYGESAGCARTLLEWIRSSVAPAGTMCVALILFQVIAWVISCCACFKRKVTDVLPTRYIANQAGDSAAGKSKGAAG